MNILWACYGFGMTTIRSFLYKKWLSVYIPLSFVALRWQGVDA